MRIEFETIALVLHRDTWFLTQKSGEAMGISIKQIDNLLQDYYAEHFS